MKNVISSGNRDWGKQASAYSKMIVDNDYPSQVNLFQKNEINMLWEKGSTMAAIQKLQAILEPKKSGKTLL